MHFLLVNYLPSYIFRRQVPTVFSRPLIMSRPTEVLINGSQTVTYGE
jgi:hypothetical protein